MRQMSAETIVNTLESGLMKQQGAALAGAERRSLAEWLTGKTIGNAAAATAGMCENRAAPFEVDNAAWTGWGNGVDNRRFAQASIDPSKLVLKWAFGFPGAAISFAQPSVTGGRMFVGSASRKVYSLDAKSGCIYWIFEPQANVRAAITITPQKVALFADQLANVYAVDARNGELLWKTHVDEHRSGHVTGAPQFWRDRLYVPISAAEDGPSLNPKYECCTARGGVVALDAKTGKILWHTYSVTETPQPTRKNAIGTQLWGPSGASIWGRLRSMRNETGCTWAPAIITRSRKRKPATRFLPWISTAARSFGQSSSPSTTPSTSHAWRWIRPIVHGRTGPTSTLDPRQLSLATCSSLGRRQPWCMRSISTTTEK